MAIATRMNTKTADILAYLQTGKPLSSLDAFRKFGATRLSAVIYQLRKVYNIESIPRTGKDRYGNSVHYVDYLLVQ